MCTRIWNISANCLDTNKNIVKLLKIQTPDKIAVITQKFEQSDFTVEECIQKVQTEWQIM